MIFINLLRMNRWGYRRMMLRLSQVECLRNCTIGVANKLSINNDKTNVVLFHMENKPVPKHFECIQTDVVQINRVNSIQYMRMLLGEHLHWQEHVDQICASVLKYFCIWNHIKKVCFVATIKTALFRFYLFSNLIRYRSVWNICERNPVETANYVK